MRKLILLMAVLLPAWGATRTATKSGNASDASVWGGTAPVNGDNLVIGNYTITQDINNLILGTGGAPVIGYVSSLSGGGGTGYTGCSVSLTGGTAVRAGAFFCAVSAGGVVTPLLFDGGRYSACPTGGTITPTGGGTGAGTTLTVGCIAGGGTAAIAMTNTGHIIFPSGIKTYLRGDIGITSACCGLGTSDAVTLNPGAEVHSDTSLSAPGTFYSAVVVSGLYSERRFGFDCSAGAQCVWDGLPLDMGSGVAPWYFRILAKNVLFKSVGSASFPFGTPIQGNPSTAAPDTEFIGNTFTNCGYLSIQDATASGSSTLKFDNNVFQNSPGIANLWASAAFNVYFNSTTAVSGTKEIVGNVFDLGMGRPNVPNDQSTVGAVSIRGNYLPAINGLSPWISNYAFSVLDGNLLYCPHGGETLFPGPSFDSYIMIDTPVSNPHVASASSGVTMVGLIYDVDDTTGTVDSGELVAYTNWTAAQNILLPTMADYSCCEWASLAWAGNDAMQAYNNIWYGGYNTAVNFGMFQLWETQVATAGSLKMQGNILWSEITDKRATKTNANGTKPVTDLCSPLTDCDYNVAFNVSSGYQTTGSCTSPWNGTGTDACTNQGNGYGGKWSVKPGSAPGSTGYHDLNDVNPRFVDPHRNLALWDTKYLRNSYQAWSSGGTYAYGDFVQHAVAGVGYNNQGVYWGLTMGFRCIAAAGCTGAPEPGTLGNAGGWRSYWEWSSLYRIRQAISAGTTYKDPALLGRRTGAGPYYYTSCSAATPCNPVQALMGWIRAGYMPQNPALWCGYNGDSFGLLACAQRKAQLAATAF